MWLGGRLDTRKTFNTVSFRWKNFKCEICKQEYQFNFKYNNQYATLVNFSRPKNANFIILKSLSMDKSNNLSFYIITIKENDKLKFGRANDADIKINDISISRCHA